MADWAARGMSMLPGLAPRPQCHIIDKQGLDETVNSTSNATFVYMRNVQDSSINVVGKVGKVTLENCSDIKMKFSDRVVGGVLELIRCQNITLTLQENAEIPTIQVDDSSNVSFHILLKSQIECVYFIRTTNLKLLLGNQTIENESGLTLQYEIPTPDDVLQTQHVAHWCSASPDANFITEVVVRDGIYPTTAQMKKAAEEREEKALLKMADMLAQGITVSKPDDPSESKSELNEKDQNLDGVD